MAETLYKSSYLESWGSGVMRIVDACRATGIEEPVWRNENGIVTVEFKRPEKGLSDLRKDSDQVPTKYRPSTDQVMELIMSMDDTYMSINEIMTIMGLKHKQTFRNNFLRKACEEGAIKWKFPSQANHPRQKYCLTTEALEWKLQELESNKLEKEDN